MLSAKVKSVLSGDSLNLTSTKQKAGSTSAPERTLALAYVSAPRFRREGDERFAFHSRDFLRRATVGKEVTFQVLYTVPTSNREYGLVFANGQNVLELAVSEGWVRVRDEAGKKDEKDTERVEKLRELEAKAKSEEKGLWAKDNGDVEALYESPDVAKLKGQSVDAIIERVLNGDRMSVRLMLEPKKHVVTTVILAGIRTPTAKRDNGSDEGEEFGNEARFFVESRLLQRNVKVEVVGASQQGIPVAIVRHPAGNISEVLLSSGLAQCVDWMSPMLGSGMTPLRAAERSAKEKKFNLWKGHIIKSKAGPGYDAVVSRIVSGDSILVRTKTGDEKRLQFSSIRQPKASDAKQQSYAMDAREFLRKKLIGKHVSVVVDHTKPAADGFDERDLATVTFGGKNVALGLVEAGLASVIRHRRDDEDRSPIYDDLLAAEQAAQAAQRGLHSLKDPPSVRLVDASENAAKAKSFLTFLQRQKRVAAVVEHVSSGSRFRLVVPRENAKITFVLAGVRTPRAGRPNEPAEPFGREALEFTNRKCLQRDVEIEVETTDRTGGFIGSLFVGKDNIAIGLLEEGLASVHDYSAEQSGLANQMYSAQTRAQEARKGIWEGYVKEEERAPTDGALEPETKRKEYVDLVITDVSTTGNLQVQIVSSGTQQLTQMMEKFRQFHVESPSTLANPPKIGDVMSARFTEDKQWYRARVRGLDRANKKADVLYIDFGNSESIPFDQLRAMPQQFSTSVLGAQSHEATLSFLKWPGEDYAQEAVSFLASLSAGKQLVANVDHRAGNAMSLTLFDAHTSSEVKESLNKEIVQEGWARVSKSAGTRGWERAYKDIVDELKKAEARALRERRGLWEYGDSTADE